MLGSSKDACPENDVKDVPASWLDVEAAHFAVELCSARGVGMELTVEVDDVGVLRYEYKWEDEEEEGSVTLTTVDTCGLEGEGEKIYRVRGDSTGAVVSVEEDTEATLFSNGPSFPASLSSNARSFASSLSFITACFTSSVIFGYQNRKKGTKFRASNEITLKASGKSFLKEKT
jgi:hypothetical protein